MKLRSIALAGLLGTGLLMTSGCGTDDIVDAINDLVKPNVVYVVNGFTTDIVAHADSDSASLAVNEMKAFALTGGSNTNVYYTEGANSSDITPLAYGNAHLYVASHLCNVTSNGFGKITDVSTGQGVVELVNATNTQLTVDQTSTVTVHVKNGATTVNHVLTLQSGITVAGCGKERSTTTIAGLGIVQGSVVSITIGSTTSATYTVEDDVPTTVDVDIVYLGSDDAVVVPLVKWDDLI